MECRGVLILVSAFLIPLILPPPILVAFLIIIPPITHLFATTTTTHPIIMGVQVICPIPSLPITFLIDGPVLPIGVARRFFRVFIAKTPKEMRP